MYDGHMFDNAEARERFDALLACEPATADRVELERIIELCAQVQALVAAVEVAVARRTRELQTSPADQTPSEVLAGKGRRGRKQGRVAAQREEACAALPSFEDALASGSVTP